MQELEEEAAADLFCKIRLAKLLFSFRDRNVKLSSPSFYIIFGIEMGCTALCQSRVVALIASTTSACI